MHKPVMLAEVLEFAIAAAPSWILDGTFGRGGHTRELLAACPGARVVALDRDVDAVEYGRKAFAEEIASGRLRIEHYNFHNFENFPSSPPGGFGVILLDLGVSSPQLDTAERGFSFYHEGPLDMRMDQTQALTAAELVNTCSEVELNDLFAEFGEVHRPQRTVRAIVEQRLEKPFTTTRELSQLIERKEGWRVKGHHPATRFFLALRMAVNKELSGLEASIPALMRGLAPNGRLITLTFHSLEDRIIKYAFKEAGELGYPLTKKVVAPSREEMRDNARARSAKLRVFVRGDQDDSAGAS